MKKILFISFILLMAVSVNAQLKVLSNGNTQGGGANGELRIETFDGYVDIGPKNSSYCHFYTDLTRFYFNKDIYLGNGIIRAYTSKDFQIWASSGYPRLVIKYINGNTGIGNYNPQYNLDVGGIINCYQLIEYSDITFKEDIRDLSRTEVSNFYHLKARNYKIKNKVDEFNGDTITSNSILFDKDKRHFGLIAQEVQEYYPELVYEDSLGVLSLDYIGFIPILIEALKEQKIKIENLEKEIEHIKASYLLTDVMILESKDN